MINISDWEVNPADYLGRVRNDHVIQQNEAIAEVYEAVPEIKEIDEAMADLSIEEAKARILSGMNEEEKEKARVTFARKLDDLIARRTALLLDNNFPADYTDLHYNCDICKDTGIDHGKTCKCIKRLKLDVLYQNSNLKNVFQEENFDTFSLDYYSHDPYNDFPASPYENAKLLLENAKRFVNDFDSNHGNILLYGETGLGKTFLTNCMAKEILDAGHTVIYLTANELFEDVLGKYVMTRDGKENLSKLVNYIYESDLLIIDDLGTEMPNNFTVSQLFEVVNRRIISKKSTIVSSNLSLTDFRSRYGERTMSRIVDNYVFYCLYGKNIRYIKKKNSL